MASISQRHSTGGRFKKRSSSDLGAGAIETQRQVEIDSLKLQQARSDEYARDYQSGMRGVAETEAWNAGILAKLESSAYENRREAIKKKAKTDVERLKGEAAEYGKKARFWENFSTTYAKQWGKATQDVTDQIQRTQAVAQLEEFYSTDEWVNFSNLEGHAAKSYLEKISNPNASPEDKKAWNELFRGLNRFARSDALAEIKKKLPDLFENLRGELEKKGVWTQDTAAKHLKDFSVHLQETLNLKKTREGKALDVYLSLYVSEEIKTLRDFEKATHEQNNMKVDMGNVFSHMSTAPVVYSDDPEQERIALRAALTKAYESVHHAWRISDDGKIIKGLKGKPPAILAAFLQEYAQYDSTRDNLLEIAMLMPDPDDPKNLDKNWGTRYKGDKGITSIEKIVDEVLEPINKAKKESETRTKENTDYDLQKKIEAVMSNTAITMDQKFETLESMKTLTIGYDESHKLMHTILRFDYNTLNPASLYSSLNMAFENGDIDQLGSVIPILPDSPEKEEFTKSMNRVRKFYENHGGKRPTHPKDSVTLQIQKSALEVSKGELDLAVQLADDVYRNAYLAALKDNPDASHTTLEQSAKTILDNQINSESGLFRLIDLGNGQKTFAVFVDDDSILLKTGAKKPNDEYFGLWKQKEGGGGKTSTAKGRTKLGNLVKKYGVRGVLNHEDHGTLWNIDDIDTYDEILLASTRGEKINVPASVEWLWKQQSGPDDLSRTEILNEILKKSTLKKGTNPDKVPTLDPNEMEAFANVKLGSLDMAEYNIKKSSIDFGDIKKYTPEELQTLGVLADTFKDQPMPMSSSLSNLYEKVKQSGGDPMFYIEDDLYKYKYFGGVR